MQASRSADGASRDIMTHVLDPLQFYSYPPGFGFEGDKNSWITSANVASRADAFADFINQKATGYATNSLMGTESTPSQQNGVYPGAASNRRRSAGGREE